MLNPRIGTVIFGRYALRRELARGGMGSVWSAQDKRLRREVAIKLLRWPESTKQMTDRFEREAMAVAQLSSPYVVRVFDYGVDGETPFIVMELLQGEDLRTRLKRRRRLNMSEICTVLWQATKALSEAHGAGIIHRDLKPGNLFLVRSRDEEIVKILDFGTAKSDTAFDETHETTKAGELLGTPQYMSPEQALAAEDIDLRTDLWSLAVILYRSMTGRLPFKGKSAADTILQICSTDARPPSSIAPDLPEEFDQFFSKALARDRRDRFASAEEMATEFIKIARISLLPESYQLADSDSPDEDEALTLVASSTTTAFTSTALPEGSLFDSGASPTRDVRSEAGSDSLSDVPDLPDKPPGLSANTRRQVRWIVVIAVCGALVILGYEWMLASDTTSPVASRTEAAIGAPPAVADESATAATDEPLDGDRTPPPATDETPVSSPGEIQTPAEGMPTVVVATSTKRHLPPLPQRPPANPTAPVTRSLSIATSAEPPPAKPPVPSEPATTAQSKLDPFSDRL